MVEAGGEGEAHAERRAWMAVLAHANLDALERYWTGLPSRPAFEHLRKPETGLVMVRARAGGSGGQFNMGEVTVTRCSVRVESAAVGHAYVMGRSKRHAELAAVFDALLQDGEYKDDLKTGMIDALAREQADRCDRRSARIAATKVDFLTMAAGRNA